MMKEAVAPTSICRNFDKDAPLQASLDFNCQVFAEDIAMCFEE
jgi:hypothetical protein